MMTRLPLIACLLAAIAGCSVLPSRVDPIEPSVDYTKLGCAEIAAKTEELKSAYRAYRGNMQHGVRLRYALLNGHVAKINEANRRNKCGFAEFLIPGQRIPGTRRRADF